MSELDPLDGELRALLDLERGAYTEDTFARAAVLRRIQAAIVLAPLAVGAAAATAAAATTATATSAAAGTKAATATAAATSAAVGTKAATATALGLGWKGAALVAVVAFGGGVATSKGLHVLAESPRPSSSGTTSAPPAAVLLPAPLASTSGPGAPAANVTEAGVTEANVTEAGVTKANVAEAGVSEPNLPPRVPPARTASTNDAAASSIEDERALVDTARAALARGLASNALAAIDEHSKRFPHGRLAEEREALAVQALALAGDESGAVARAARFRRAFPTSIFTPAVDRAVARFERKRDAAP